MIGGDYQLSQRGACLIFQEVFWPCQLRNNLRNISAHESLHKHIHPPSSCMLTRHFQLHILLLSWQEENDNQPLVNTDFIFLSYWLVNSSHHLETQNHRMSHTWQTPGLIFFNTLLSVKLIWILISLDSIRWDESKQGIGPRKRDIDTEVSQRFVKPVSRSPECCLSNIWTWMPERTPGYSRTHPRVLLA